MGKIVSITIRQKGCVGVNRLEIVTMLIYNECPFC